MLWCVLIIGGTVTIASASMFGSANTFLHALQVFAFSLLIALVLVAIADIDRPFQGSVHVKNLAFRRALESMKTSAQGFEASCFSESAIALRKASTAGTDGDSRAFFAHITPDRRRIERRPVRIVLVPAAIHDEHILR